MISSITKLDWMEEAVDAMAAAGTRADTWQEPEPALSRARTPADAVNVAVVLAGDQALGSCLQNMS